MYAWDLPADVRITRTLPSFPLTVRRTLLSTFEDVAGWSVTEDRAAKRRGRVPDWFYSLRNESYGTIGSTSRQESYLSVTCV